MVIIQDLLDGLTSLSQEQFTVNMLEKYHKYPHQKFNTPAEVNMYKQVEDFIMSGKEPVKSEFPYRGAVG